jgi:hypothetical protein
MRAAGFRGPRILFIRRTPDMDIPTMIFAAVVVFAVAAFILMRVFKKAAMEELRLHYGEKLIFDDDNCVVDLPEESLSNIFVRLTNMRVLIGQRGGGTGDGKRSGKHQLRFVIYYEDVPSLRGVMPDTTEKGYVTFKTEPKSFSLKEGAFRIEAVPDGGAGVPAWLAIKGGNTDTFREYFGL